MSPPRTRDVLRWNEGARDLLDLAALAIAGAVLVVLDAACDVVERWIDERGERC